MNHLIVVLFGVNILLGCADSHRLVRNDIASEVKLAKTDSIYVAVSNDGLYGSHTYVRSGLNSSQIILAAFAKRSKRAEMGNVHQEVKEALQYATTNSFRYLVYPTILHWEDRRTEWSGIPDKVEIKIEVIEATKGNVIDSVIIKGKSGWATLGGDHPQDLLPKPVEDYVASLYATE